MGLALLDADLSPVTGVGSLSGFIAAVHGEDQASLGGSFCTLVGDELLAPRAVESTCAAVMVLSSSSSVARRCDSEFGPASLVVMLPLAVEAGDCDRFALRCDTVSKSSGIVTPITLVDTSRCNSGQSSAPWPRKP